MAHNTKPYISYGFYLVSTVRVESGGTRENKIWQGNKPNYFFFVINGFTIDVDALPDYAGLIIIEDNIVKRIKNPEKLHGGKISHCGLKLLTRGISIRYWMLRKYNQEQINIKLG